MSVEVIVAAVIAALAVRVAAATGLLSVTGTVAAFTGYFSGWRPDPWPPGVQEEDPERPWGRPARRTRGEVTEPPLSAPTLTPLRPQIRQR
ncbi:hypothetical protein BH24CHL7_BH24CHL7_00140 [soil metagenome]